VGTGLEETVARDSGAVVIARRAGVATRVTADEIIIDAGEEEARMGEHPLARLKQHDRYRLKKFWRTNQDTAINQRPLVHAGQKVKAGQIVADGAGTERGELALGANVLVAFMPWYGHNFEDAIVLSERLVKDDVYSSIHIQELELHVRDTKRGREEITREIPNVAEESLVDLDERGIVRIGAHVKAGDILVGKITPKGETELSPEEKLLTAIFGEKAKDVKDSSLKVPPGMEGVVIDVKIFSRIEDQVVEKDRGERIGEVRRLEAEEKARISDAMFAELAELLTGQEVGLMLKAGTVEEYLPQGTKLTKQQLDGVQFADVDLKTLRVTNKTVNERIRAVLDAATAERAKIEEKSEDQIDKILQPDELPPGVIQLVKVYVAEKRKISVGDKMAGRHGNKGIIARIVPEEDMPFLPNGTPVDIVLNPLGVPSRMNVGQILETHLGWAASILGFEAKTPVFQGADETEIGVLLRLAGLTWAADALRLVVRPPELDQETVRRIAADLRRLPDTNGGRPDLAKSGIGLLASRALTQETRDVHHQFVDFLKAAAKQLAERELDQRKVEREFHQVRLEGGEGGEGGNAKGLSKAEQAALKAGLKESEKFVEHDKPQDVLEAVGWPALAALLGPKSEADLDQAANELLKVAGLTPTGKARLRDGRSGEFFASDVTVGSIYMMKLSHLVDDKIHARSIGPYSLVTQQPLAGKAQFGGQRFGEMEVWALEAYGAAHTLQEILTVKSDDVNGRSRVYEAIVKGQNLPKPGIPESFNVLVKELQALGLKVTLGTTEDVEE
jgi:DNA-directed RNA polymerase subunit beta